MSLVLLPYGSIMREKKWSFAEKSEQLICQYKFFYILAHDLGVASNIKWYSSDNPEKELTHEQVKQLYPTSRLRLGIWEGYSLLVVIGLVISLSFLGY